MATSTNYEILLTIFDLSQGALSTPELAERRGVGDRTIKSYIAQARHLGADIRSTRGQDGYAWSIVNFPEIEDRVLTWIDLEEKGL